MNNFIGTRNGESIILTNSSTSKEIGVMQEINKNQINFKTTKGNYQILTSTNKIEVLKNGEKIDEFEKYNIFQNFQSNNSPVKIKGISSLQGGTQITDNKDRTLTILNNQSPLFDNGVYKFETFSTIEPYQLALMLHLHMKGSKIKTTIAIVAAVIMAPIIIKLFN